MQQGSRHEDEAGEDNTRGDCEESEGMSGGGGGGGNTQYNALVEVDGRRGQKRWGWGRCGMGGMAQRLLEAEGCGALMYTVDSVWSVGGVRRGDGGSEPAKVARGENKARAVGCL